METQVWNIDPAHSSIGFTVRHLVISKVRGRFGQFKGVIRFDGVDLGKASAQVEIDAASVDTGTADRDKHLRSPDFFDAEQFPVLSFRSTRIEPKADGQHRAIGELTIRGVTREIELDLEYAGQAKDPWGNQRLLFTARAALDRRDFGLKWNQALETGGVLVGERVEIELDVQAVKAAASQAA